MLAAEPSPTDEQEDRLHLNPKTAVAGATWRGVGGRLTLKAKSRRDKLFEAYLEKYRKVLTMTNEDVQKTLAELSRDLQESKARLEEAQRVAHVGHWEWDLETDGVVWSDETYRIFGLRPQERPMDLATVRA